MDKELQEAYAALQIYLSAVEELAIANLLWMSGVLRSLSRLGEGAAACIIEGDAMIKVMIVDDQEIVREGLKMILSMYKEVSVIGEVPNGRVLLEQLEVMNPDVILMDIRMPVMDGITAAQLVKERHPEIKVIILTTFDEDEYIIQGLKNGVEGYILKDSGSADILNAIKTVYAGSVLLNSKVTERMVEAISSGQDNPMPSRQEAPVPDKLGLLTPRGGSCPAYPVRQQQ